MIEEVVGRDEKGPGFEVSQESILIVKTYYVMASTKVEKWVCVSGN